MNKLGKWIDKVYAMFWRPTTRRPWTYVMRQWSVEHQSVSIPLVISALCLIATAPVAATILWHWWALPVSLASCLLFMLVGHLYWDTDGGFIKHEDYFND